MASPGYSLDPSLLPQFGNPYQTPAFDPNAVNGGNPMYYPYQIAATNDPYLSYNPSLATNDPNTIFREAQATDYNVGAGIAANTYQQQQQQEGLYNAYGNAANSAFGQLAQQPGYSAQDASNIIQSDRINGAVATPGQYASLTPTDAETAGMTGNVGSYSQYYNPSAIYDAQNQMGQNMAGTIQATQGGMGNVTGQQQTALNNAANIQALNPGSSYYNNMSDVLNTTAGRISDTQSGAASGLSSALSNPGLNTTSQYAQQAGMTDAEVQQTANEAANNVGLQAQAQKDSIARAAAAAGNASPLAVAAAQARAGEQGMVATGDAVTDAYLNARAQQRQAATGVQQTQLGAAQYQTGAQIGSQEYQGSLGSQNAQYEGQLAQGNIQDVQNTTQSAAQYQAGLMSQNANSAANSQLQALQYSGNQGMQAAQALGQQGLAGQEYMQSTGTGIAEAQDQAAAQRAAQLYGIRQGNTQYGINSNYQQNMGAAGALSQGYQTVANQGLYGQQQYRNYLTGQQSQALGAAQTANQQQIQNYGTMSGAMNNNASQWANYQLGKGANSFSNQLGSAFAGSLGRTLGG